MQNTIYRLDVTTKSGEHKSIRIDGKHCNKDCDFIGKIFQGYGGWLGFEVDGCRLSGKQLETNKNGSIRCQKCLDLCKQQIEEHNKIWIKKVP